MRKKSEFFLKNACCPSCGKHLPEYYYKCLLNYSVWRCRHCSSSVKLSKPRFILASMVVVVWVGTLGPFHFFMENSPLRFSFIWVYALLVLINNIVFVPVEKDPRAFKIGDRITKV